MAKSKHAAETEEERLEHEASGGKAEMKEEMGKPEYAAKGGHMRRARRAQGGASKVNVYNAEGSPEVKEAEDTTESFRKGGHAKRRAGGVAEGTMAMPRADRAPRGRHAAGGRAGGSPYSSGSKIEAPRGGGASAGHEGQTVPPEPGPG